MHKQKNNLSANILILLCPFIPSITMYCLNFLQVVTSKTYTFNITAYYILIFTFFLSFILFVYLFLIRKYKANLLIVIIGILELLLFQNSYFSYNVLGVIQNGNSIYLHGCFLSIYLIIGFITIKDKKFK